MVGWWMDEWINVLAYGWIDDGWMDKWKIKLKKRDFQHRNPSEGTLFFINLLPICKFGRNYPRFNQFGSSNLFERERERKSILGK